MDTYKPIPHSLDVVLTVGHPPIKNFLHWIACKGIQFYQWRRGYHGRAWVQTHARWYIGRLTPELIEKAVLEGRVSAGAQAENLRYYDDWMLSVTDPLARWERWESIRHEDWTLVRPITEPRHDHNDVLVAERACWKLIGEEYDRGQLVDIWLNTIMHLPKQYYVPCFDSGAQHTVCSGGIAAGWEAIRRQRVQNGIACWPRLFGGTYVERVCPAMFIGRPRNESWGLPFLAIGASRNR